MTTKSAALAGVLLALAGLIATPSPAAAQPLAGIWDATVVVNKLDIPFRFEIAGDGAAIKGSFFNGDEKVTSTSGTFENGTLTLLVRRIRNAAHCGAEGWPARGRVQPRHARCGVSVSGEEVFARRGRRHDHPVDRRPVEHPGEELEG